MNEASTTIGTRLKLLLEQTGLADVHGFGIQGCLARDDLPPRRG
jgi:hypothetical protein